MDKNKRLHIGVLFATMDNSCQYDIWTGIVEYARRNDINLTAFFGAYQTTSLDISVHFESCINTILNSSSLDGVIMFSGFIAYVIGNDEVEKYAGMISGHIPVISVSYIMPGIPSVIIDNAAGMYSAVNHTIQAHGKKRIAFVKGPDGHPEAEERLEGYKKALRDNNIDYDVRYVYPGNFSPESGRAAVIKMLGDENVSADAIVACDDITAIGVLNELKKHEIFAPADIAVAGFDDDRDSETCIPSLSTVRQDFYQIGQISAQLLHNKINNQPVDEVNYVQPVFVARQSCGCLERTLSDHRAENCDGDNDAQCLLSYTQREFTTLFEDHVPVPQIIQWASRLTDVIKEKHFMKDKFISLINDILISYQQYSRDVMPWSEALDVLTAGVRNNSGEIESVYAIMSAFVNASALVHEMRIKEEKLREIAVADNRIMLRRIAGNLVLKLDIDSLAEELRNSLPELSLNTVIIGLYQKPIRIGDCGADRKIESLIGFVGDSIINTATDERNPVTFSDYATIREFDSLSRRFELFFIPLFAQDEELGIMLMPFDADISVDTFEMLRVNISTAVKGSNLIKEIEYQNKQATEANKAKSDFLSRMSHEIRTPMNAIIGMTAIGKKANEAVDKDYALTRIGDASTHLLGVINDILDMTKIEADKLELVDAEFDFGQMIEKVLTIVGFRVEEKRQSISINADERIPMFLFGDDQRLVQVITNLMSNAIKFTPENGMINLNITIADKNGDDCRLRFEVEDSGIGIHPEQQKKIFSMFEQADSGTSREYGGTGLGLSISKRIIEMMGGEIWVESQLGEGAKFIFTVNLKCGQKTDFDLISRLKQNDESAAFSENEFEGKRLLVVEDVEINREIVILLLHGSGMLIDCAENGLEALDIVAASPGKHDIVFMDVQMPKMDGYEATRAIRALPDMRNIRLPIIAMTANVFKSDIDNSLAAGMDDHIGKPLDIGKVMQILRKYLH